jgi:excisionase family DNA binding protein
MRRDAQKPRGWDGGEVDWRPVESDAAWIEHLEGRLRETDPAFFDPTYVPPKPRRTVEPHEPSTRMLTLAEAGALVRASPETIRYWVWQGRLEAFKPGRSVLVREADLLQLVEARETRRMRAGRAQAAATRRR